MKPIPVVFHLGPLQIHTYGIGLAITFWFALWYMRRRFDANGIPSEWLNRAFLAVIAAAIIGARAVHVVANIHYYRSNLGEILSVWHGGLSSFGGLLLGVPVGIWYKRRYCPELGTMAALDLAAPVLMAAWALGRLLGPQVMVNGGGHPTAAWYGLEYAGQVGRRVPVPLFQAVECFAIWGALVWIERRTRRHPTGVMVAAFLALWGMARFADEFFWLATPRLWDAVEVTGLALAAAGWGVMAALVVRGRRAVPVPAVAGASASADPGGKAAQGGLVGLGEGGERVDDVGQHGQGHAGTDGEGGLPDPLVGLRTDS